MIIKRPLTQLQSRALAIALLLLCLTICALLLYLPTLLLHRHFDRELANTLDYLQRYRNIAATRDGVQAGLTMIKKLDGRKYFLKSTGQALAASQIQETGKIIIESSRGKLVSMQVVPVKEEGVYRRVTVNFQMSCNIISLRSILYALELMPPYLFVDNLGIRSQVNAQYKPVAGVDPEMNVQFDLSGYALPVESK